MSIYTTPLQFGYFLGLLFALLFWLRSWNEERLSDRLLGFVLFFLAMEIQDYTFGFAGINILWEELNGFPRYFHLAFAPTIYFYLQAQINHEFYLKKKDFIHYLPYFIYFLVNLGIFLQGKNTVLAFQKSELSYWLSWFERIIVWSSYSYYFYQSLQRYKMYRKWTETQFSDTESIGFVWLRNFIYLIIAGEIFRFSWGAIDTFLGDLPFEQDWWWHLFTVGIICYVAIKGYAQPQPQKLVFSDSTLQNEATSKLQKLDNNPNFLEWKPKIEKLLVEEQLFLQPDLSLADMATKLRTNVSVLSAAINQNFNKNFNDFVNEHRVEEFKKQLHLPKNKHLTLLAIAFDCGFNSKATFNRAVKKATGLSPKEL